MRSTWGAVWIMKENRYRQACSLKSDKDIQQAARRLGIDKKKLRRAMNNGGCRRSRWTQRGAGPQEPIMSPRSWDWTRRPCALTCEVGGKRANGQKNSGERARAGWNTLLTLTSDRRTR